MPGIFRTTNPLSIVVLFFYGMVLRFAALLDPVVPVANPSDGVLYHSVIRGLKAIGGSSGFIYAIFAYLLVYAQALMINSVFFRHRLLTKPNFLPALAYVMVTALFPEWWTLSSTLIVNTFIIVAWNHLTALYKSPKAKQLVFNAGIIIGLGSFFYFPSLAFVLMAIAAILIMRPFSLPELLLCILGATVPYYFLFAWLYLSGSLDIHKYIPNIAISYPQFQQSIWAWIALLLLMVPFLFSGIYIQNQILRMLIQVRKNWSLILVYLLIALLVPFINGSKDFEYWILCAVPFAAFHANVYFAPQKKWLPAILHWGTAAFILALNYYVLTQ
ncbi:MAG: hypothetical protein EAZ17_00365 [Sphingobacteriales bacterium]|nr:MAG: hypothetical protein EAZ17_00365 [Sphingobacteriales bacterium]